MNIRPYKPDDLVKLVETYTAAVHVLARSYYSPDQIVAWAPVPADVDRWRQKLSQLHTRVAEKDGYFAGFASYTSGGYLDFLFTHPKFARCGVASILYQLVESELAQSGVYNITVHASLAARCFFDSQGFLMDYEEEVECRGVSIRRFRMHKDLHT